MIPITVLYLCGVMPMHTAVLGELPLGKMMDLYVQGREEAMPSRSRSRRQVLLLKCAEMHRRGNAVPEFNPKLAFPPPLSGTIAG